MPAVVLVIVSLLLLGLPRLWAEAVLRRHSRERPDLPGTGGQFARFLLDDVGLRSVKAEPTALGDHYDPTTRAVRLNDARWDGRSLAAIVVAAHEVGHALQDHVAWGPLRLRTQLAGFAVLCERVARVLVMLSPVVLVATRSARAMLVMGVLLAASLTGSVLVHLVTLPVELDASFRKALPILEEGGHIPPEDLPAARELLWASALTYVAAALASVLTLGRRLTPLGR